MNDDRNARVREVRGSGKGNPLTGVAQSEAADRLKAEVQEYLAAQAQRLLTGVGQRLGRDHRQTQRHRGRQQPRLRQDGPRRRPQTRRGQGAPALRAGSRRPRAKDNVVGAFKNLAAARAKGKGKGGAGRSRRSIIEFIDVGVPLRTAYDQWTQYQDFTTFAKGVKSAKSSAPSRRA